jgi:hypothetical protein
MRSSLRSEPSSQNGPSRKRKNGCAASRVDRTVRAR